MPGAVAHGNMDTMSEPGLQSFQFSILRVAEGKRVPGRQWSTCCRRSRISRSSSRCSRCPWHRAFEELLYKQR